MGLKKIIIFSILTFCFLSCGTSKEAFVFNSSPPFEGNVEVIETDQKIPENVLLIGFVKIGDSGFTTKCSYREVIRDAIIEAKKMGGNIIYIDRHLKPNIWSTCHRIECKVYKRPTRSNNTRNRQNRTYNNVQPDVLKIFSN